MAVAVVEWFKLVRVNVRTVRRDKKSGRNVERWPLMDKGSTV